MKLILVGAALLVLGVFIFFRGCFGFNFGEMCLGIALVIFAAGVFIAAIVAGL